MRVRHVLLGFFLGLIAVPAFAGTDAGTATVAGTVRDPEGKVVRDAVVLVRREATSDLRTTATDAVGHFAVAGLVDGAYAVEVAVPGFDIVRRAGVMAKAGAAEEIAIQLSVANISETVTVSAALPAAAVAAPSQASLTARSAQSLISNEYIRNYTSPFSDYSQVLQMAPGTFSTSANGPGLSDTKTFFRGFKDGQYSMTFDGIPFNDTNDPTHHSWVFFPATTIGSTVFERSPGSASAIGPSTYGGSVNLLSRSLPTQQMLDGTISYGSFNTKLFDLEFDSGRIGDGSSRFLIEAHEMRSDGYQTRAQVAQFGDDFLMTGAPASPLYYGYNFYRVPTNFEYVGVRKSVGGWSFDDRVYTMRYYNKQNYNSTTAISTTSATDKLNSYWKVGNNLPATYVTSTGVIRTGLWLEYASTDRYQTPSDPRTWIDAALPNFREMFGTTTVQPCAEYEYRAASNLTITPGIKYARYTQDFTQFADNGKIVGSLNGAASIQHAVTYGTWLPSVDAHYMLQSYWSMYAQYGKGQNIPPTSIFDVKGAQVAITPKPILTDTAQVGSVWKSRRATLDVDYYHVHFQNDYSSTFDPASGDTVYFLTADSVTQGVEAESTILVGGGLAVYLNGTKGSARYTDTNQWAQNAPGDTETIGLTFNRDSWNLGFFNKRVGQMFNDNGAAHEAVAIDPFNITNVFLNYTVKGASKLANSRIRMAVNNLTDNHAITAVSPASTKSNAPNAADVLTLMSGRSVSVSFTIGVATR